MERKTPCVFISGISSGIGRSTALAFMDKGYKVYGTVRNSVDLQELSDGGLPLLQPIFMELRDNGSIANAVNQVMEFVLSHEEHFIGIVNNAGIIVPGPLELLSDQEYKDLFQVNFFGQVRVIHCFLPLLRQHTSRIINVTSIGAEMPLPFLGAYAASKAAFNSYSNTLRLELKKFKIDVTQIEPQPVLTPGWEKFKVLLEELKEKHKKEISEFYQTEYNLLHKSFRKRKFYTLLPEKIGETIVDVMEKGKTDDEYKVGLQSKLVGLAKKVTGQE